MARRKPQNPIKDIIDAAGAWLGGNRGTIQSTGAGTAQRPNTQAANQTTFGGLFGRTPQYPQPQSIRKMPLQNAGYDDQFNKRGQVASTRNLPEYSEPGYEKTSEVFIRDINTVYVNPAYMSQYIDPPATADRKEAKAKKFENLTNQLPSFADANSKYFDKNFEVLPYPKKGNPKVYGGKTVDPKTTMQVNIRTGKHPDPTAWAWAWVDPLTKNVPGKSIKFQEETPRQKDIVFSQESDFQKHSKYVQSVLQHEFQHVLGKEHSTRHDTKRKQDKNTVTSYAKETRLPNSSQLPPADINFWKQVQNTVDVKRQNTVDVKRRAKSAYKGVAKKRK